MTKDLELKLIITADQKKAGESLDRLANAIKKIETISNKSTSQITKGHNDSEKAVSKHEKEVNKLKKEYKEVERASISATKSTQAFGGAFKSIASIVTLGLIVKVFKDISKAAIDAAESENLFEVSMGRMAQSARRWSEETAKALGLNAYEIRKNVGILNTMLNSMGLAETKAYGFSKSLTKLSYDMASFYNLNPDEAFQKLQAAISGESEPLKRLGIIINETTSKQALLNHGIVSQTKNLTEAQKVTGRYLAIMDATQKAQGDMARTSDSTSNQIKKLQSRLSNLAITAGKTLTPAIDELVDKLINLTDNSEQLVTDNGPKLINTFKTIASTVQNTVSTIFSAVNTLNSITLGGFETAFNGVLSSLNTASYIAAKLAKEIELLTAISKQSQGIPTENEFYQKKLVQMGINPDTIPLEAQVNPSHPLNAKLKQAYALAKSEHVQLKYGDQNPEAQKVKKLQTDIANLEKNWLETQKKLLIKPYSLNEGLKDQNKKLKEERHNANIGEGFVMPVKGNITSNFGVDRGDHKHSGIDIANKSGTKIKSSAGGKVIHVGKLGNYGNAIIIDHGNGLTSLYGHLSKYLVKKGQVIPQEFDIGQMGSTGRSTGSHLHWELRKDNKAVDPYSYLGSEDNDVVKTQEIKESKLLKKYGNEKIKYDRLKELLSKPDLFGLSKPAVTSHDLTTDNTRIKELGLSDEDVKLVTSQASEMFDKLKEIEAEYITSKEKTQKKISEIYDKTLSALAETQVQYEEATRNIKAEEAPETEKQKALDFEKQKYLDTTQKIKTDYAKELAETQKDLTNERIELLKKETEIVANETEKQLEIQLKSEEETRDIRRATQKIYQDMSSKRSILEAQASNDLIAIVRAEYVAKQSTLDQEKRLIVDNANEKITQLNKLQEQEAEFSESVRSIENEKIAVAENATAQIAAIRQDEHYNEMERIKEETDAWAAMFEKRLGFISKTAGIIGKIIGGNNIFTKASSFISSNSSLLGDIFGKLKMGSVLPTGQSSSSGNIVGSIASGIKNIVSGSKSTNVISSISPLTTSAPIINMISPAFAGAETSGSMTFTGGGLASMVTGTSSNLGSASTGMGNLFGAASNLQSSGGLIKGVGSIKELFSGGLGKSLFGAGKVGSVLGPLAGAGIGGFTGYALGQKNMALGIGGGIASGALGGAMLAGPVGAIVGGAAGLIGGILGAIFGRRKKKETKWLGQAEATGNRYLSSSAYRMTQIQEGFSGAEYLDQMDSVMNQMTTHQRELEAQQQEIMTQLTSSRFKKKGKEAEELRTKFQEAFEQNKSQLQQLEQQMLERIKQRNELISETKDQLEIELAQMQAQNVHDPYNFNADLWKSQEKEATQNFQEIMSKFRDSPEIQALVTKKRQEEISYSNYLRRIGHIEADKAKAEILSDMEITHLEATEASQASIIKAEKEAKLKELSYTMKKMREEVAGNQEILTQLTQYETDQRVLIEKDAQKQIEEAYKTTGSNLADLISKRKEITGMYDYQRAKTNTEIKKEQLSDIDKQIREQYPEFVKMIENLNTSTLSTMTPDQLADINKDLQSVSNFVSSPTWNNVITIEVSGNTPQEVATNIKKELQTLLNAQRRLPV